MLLFILFFVTVVSSIILYLDYKKDPTNNLVINNLKLLNENIHVQNVIKPILPHAEKFGVDKTFIFPLVVIVALVLLSVIIKVLF